MKNNDDTFEMWCPKCGAEYNISPHNTNPICRCGAPLDFEPSDNFVPIEETAERVEDSKGTFRENRHGR